YGILLEEKKPTSLADLQSRTKSTQELITQPTLLNQAELLWRLSLPLTAFNLVLMAIPMSFVNPRAGRTYSLLFALLAYVVYS
ncbi:LptF/LptG family permease, partial [Acinetobacter baumannii]